ncbi:MAG TPA: histidine kinase [Gemmatimonadales bacterium]|nr:histidine kinase [Gemmatimonadales bacterium]
MRLKGWRLAALWTALFTIVGLLEFSYRYLDVLARALSEPLAIKFIEEMTGAYGAAVLLPFAIWVVRRARARGMLGWRLLLVHAAVLPVYSILHTTWNGTSRALVFPLVGLGAYDYGRMPLRYAMEFPMDVLGFTLWMGLVYLFDRYSESRDREVRVAQLETELTRVRLSALEGQLRPHFLFNVLNTISSVMYEDVAAADTMLARLADLLRRTLRRPSGTEIPLAEEMETLGLYLDIMRVRFAERLSVDVQVDDAVRDAAVPALVLQPLVENALRHGDPGPGAPARITVRARRDDGRVLLEVEDNGPGLAGTQAEVVGKGVGLANTARRLEQLYGDRQALTLSNLTGGGLRVAVELPFHTPVPTPGHGPGVNTPA